MDRSYVIENQRERQRLEALVRRLDDRALASPMDAGWTVAAVLGHLAFWDQRIVLLTEQFRAGGDVNPMNERDVDWINDAAKPMMLAMPPRQLAELAISIAAAADRAVEALTDAQLQSKTVTTKQINVLRAEHRREHLDEIDQALARRAR